MMDSTRNLRLGIPSKGRLAEVAEDLLHAAGLSFRRQERSLFARVRELPVDVTFLRTDDIPVLCAEGAIDLGITGSDLVEEKISANMSGQLRTRLALGMGRCRLALCAPDNSLITSPAQLHGKRVATSFPNVTLSFLKKSNAIPHLVELSGSVEVMIALGVADAIVDLIETGSTLAANRLKILEEIGSYETVVLENHAHPFGDLANRVIRRLEGVVIARAYSLLEYNVRRDVLNAAEKITPGFHSPTVSALEDPAWCAVRVMVKRGEVIRIMEELESLGAEAILETQISNCRLGRTGQEVRA